MFVASVAFQVGQLIGLVILVLVTLGVARTFPVGDLTRTHKQLGIGDSVKDWESCLSDLMLYVMRGTRPSCLMLDVASPRGRRTSIMSW
jgi:hypothetical protein